MRRSKMISGLFSLLFASVAFGAATSIDSEIDLATTGDVTWEAITGSGNIVNSGEELRTINLSNAAEGTYTYSGVISGNIAVKMNAATSKAIQIFNKANTYSGGTVITKGEIRLTASAARAGTGPIALTGSGNSSYSALLTATTSLTLPNQIIVDAGGGCFRIWSGKVLTIDGSILFLNNSSKLRTDDGGTLSLNKPIDPESAGGIFEPQKAVFCHNCFGTPDAPSAITLQATSAITSMGYLELPKRCYMTTNYSTNKSVVAVTDTLGGDLTVARSDKIGISGYLSAAYNISITADEILLSKKEVNTFEISGTLTLNGRLSSRPGTSFGFIKKGSGKLVIKDEMDIKGDIKIQAGTLVLSTNALASVNGQIIVSPGATVQLDDGTLLHNRLRVDNLHTGFLKTADVWFDAYALADSSVEGAGVNAAPNFGIAGGDFVKMPRPCNNGAYMSVPYYTTNGISGKPSIVCDSTNKGLQLDAYTNKTANMTMFLVFQWDRWVKNGDGNGAWGAPIAMSSRTGSAGDAKNENDSMGFTYSWGEGSIGFSNSIYRTAYGCADKYCDYTALQWKVGQPAILGFSRNGKTAIDWLTLETGTLATTNNNGYTYAFGIETLALGKCLQANGCPHWNRGLLGKIGELVVFNRELTEAEFNWVNDYLAHKWLNGAAPGAQPISNAPASSRVMNPMDITVSEGNTSTVSFEAAGQSGSYSLIKSGAGAMQLAGDLDYNGEIIVNEGGIVFGDGKAGISPVLWVDAGDDSTLTVNEGGKVLSVVNKGSAGGSFTAEDGTAPEYDDKGMNSKGAIVFDGSAMLSSQCRVATGDAQRNLHIYAVLQRDEPVAGSGPFSFENSDGDTGSIFSVEELADTGNAVCFHFGSSASLIDPVSGATANSVTFANPAADDTPYLLASNQRDNMYLVAFENAATEGNTPWKANSSSKQNLPALNADTVVLGGRGGVAWKGRIGELIVFDEEPTALAKGEVLEYLRNKWFKSEAEEMETPLALTGIDLQAKTGADVTLVLADNVALRHDAPPVTVGTVKLPDTLEFTTSLWPQFKRQLFSAETVDGDPVWNISGRRADSSKITINSSEEIWLHNSAAGTIILIR